MHTTEVSPGNGPQAPVTAAGLIRWLLHRQRGRVAAGAAAGVAWMGAMALIPVALGGMIDALAEEGFGTEVGLWCAGIALAVLAEAGTGVLRHQSAIRLYVRSQWYVERLITHRVLDARGGAGEDAGKLLSHVQNDALAVAEIADITCRGSGAIVAFFAVGAGLVIKSPLLGGLLLVGLPPCLLILAPLRKPYERLAGERNARLAEATSVAADSLRGLRVVKGLGGDRAVRSWFVDSSRGVERSAVALARVNAAWDALAFLLPGLFLVTVVWVGGRLAVAGTIAPGELVAFTGLAVFLAIPVSTIAEIGWVWAFGVAGARRIAGILSSPPDVEDAPGDGRPQSDRIDFRNVESGPVRGLGFTVLPGERVGIACAGAVVAGELADLLARRRDPEAGAVLLDDIDLRDVPLQVLRRRVLVESGHSPWLADASVRSNLSLGDPDAGDERLTEALMVAAGEDIASRPAGLDEPVGEAGLALSGGQRQRLALARALVPEAPVLVLDDPTSALDTITETRLAKRLARHREGRTTVVLSVSPTLLAAMDRVIFLDASGRTFDGTHQELMETVRGYRELIAPRDAVGG